MYRRLAPAVLLLGALAGLPDAMLAQTASKCRPADAKSVVLINYLKELMTTTDPDEAFARDNHYKVPVVSVSQVTLVTDARTCDKASAAYGPPSGSTTNPTVYVVKLGAKGYAVLDPNPQPQTVMIFDTKWVRIGGWTGP